MYHQDLSQFEPIKCMVRLWGATEATAAFLKTEKHLRKIVGCQ